MKNKVSETEIKESEIAENEILEAMAINVYCAREKCLNRADDLISAGNAGIMDALKSFNRDKKCKFSTYARFFIQRNQRRELTNICKGVHIPHGFGDYLKNRDSIGELLWLDEFTKDYNEDYSILDSPANLFRPEKENARLADLEECLARLKKTDLELIRMYFYEGYSFRQIAEITKRPAWETEWAVKGILARIRELMEHLAKN